MKIIDFGLSAFINSRDNGRAGSPYYMAPEVIKNHYCYESDVWSLGVILFVIIIGDYPFKGANKEELYEQILANNYNIDTLEKCKVSKEVKDLIRRIFVLDIDKRITVDEMLGHKWIDKLMSQDAENNIIDPSIIDSLKSFAHMDLLKKEIFFYMARISNEEEIDKLKKMFMKIDTDSTGTIEIEEVVEACKLCGLDMKDVFNLFRRSMMRFGRGWTSIKMERLTTVSF